MKERYQTQQTSTYSIQGKRVNRQAESSLKVHLCPQRDKRGYHIHETNTHTKAATGRGGCGGWGRAMEGLGNEK